MGCGSSPHGSQFSMHLNSALTLGTSRSCTWKAKLLFTSKNGLTHGKRLNKSECCIRFSLLAGRLGWNSSALLTQVAQNLVALCIVLSPPNPLKISQRSKTCRSLDGGDRACHDAAPYSRVGEFLYCTSTEESSKSYPCLMLDRAGKSSNERR